MARSHGRELWFDTELGDEYYFMVVTDPLVLSRLGCIPFLSHGK